MIARALLLFVFSLSGASALIFETLWFHGAGIALGNSVWASSLVLAAFMAGLALGNALALRGVQRWQRPIRLYALLEIAIGLIGLALVYGLPLQAHVLAPFLGGIDSPLALNVARFILAFGALLVPSTAMGLTLPVLTRALSRRDSNFGSVLGALYGANTAGAVVGAVGAEVLLIGAFGVHGTAGIAAGMNLVAAGLAWRLDRREDATEAPDAPPADASVLQRPRMLVGLGAAALSGFLLLALEVIWFRFLSLYVLSRSESFAVMMGVVLAGISAGGWLAAHALRRGLDAERAAPHVALLAGAACVACYAAAPLYLAPFAVRPALGIAPVIAVALPLMFPVSMLSGLFFTVVGVVVRRSLHQEGRAASALTLANTLGASVGPLAAGFVMLPTLGIERSIFVIASLYAAIGLTWALFSGALRQPRALVGVGTAAVALLAFPWGAMHDDHLPNAAKRWLSDTPHRIFEVREGVQETAIYVRGFVLGEAYSTRLVTNALSMSGNDARSRRYMKLFSYWPLVFHEDPKRALLISYGLGSTAKSLTDQASFEAIDIVDISRDIFEMSELVFPPVAHPLRDSRVRRHVEDGRYFLQTTHERYDVITGEPPPPAASGVVNLYTREYFGLVRDRLADGGIFTYWLPVHSITEGTTRSILRAFCDVFPDCSLWHGSGEDLMMVGTNGLRVPPDVARFTALWRDEGQRAELEALGFERPEQWGALFVGDANYLREITREALPALDAWPKRVAGPRSVRKRLEPLHHSFADATASRRRFETSGWIGTIWPREMRDASLAYFGPQQIMNDVYFATRSEERSAIRDAHDLLTGTSLRAPFLLLLRSDADLLRLARKASATGPMGPGPAYHLAVDALADRDYRAALPLLERAEASGELRGTALALRIFTLAMLDEREAAEQLANARYQELGVGSKITDYWAGLDELFGIRPAALRDDAPLARRP